MAGEIGGIGPQRPVALQDARGLRVEPLGGEGPSFGETLERALGDVTELQETARDAIEAFVRGEPVELHEVMAATEEAGIALDLLIEIRNKLVDAYRAVIGMQA